MLQEEEQGIPSRQMARRRVVRSNFPIIPPDDAIIPRGVVGPRRRRGRGNGGARGVVVVVTVGRISVPSSPLLGPSSSTAIRRDNARVRGPGGRSHTPALSQVRLRRRRRVRRCYSIAVARRWQRPWWRRMSPVVDDDNAIPRARRRRQRRRRARKSSTIASIASVGVDGTSPENDDRNESTTAFGVSRRYHRRADTPNGRSRRMRS